eukprot:10329770-Alexandrium_andersonii.AAC.1
MSASLVGSEMCIRDRALMGEIKAWPDVPAIMLGGLNAPVSAISALRQACLLYTSDAADDM